MNIKKRKNYLRINEKFKSNYGILVFLIRRFKYK